MPLLSAETRPDPALLIAKSTGNLVDINVVAIRLTGSSVKDRFGSRSDCERRVSAAIGESPGLEGPYWKSTLILPWCVGSISQERLRYKKGRVVDRRREFARLQGLLEKLLLTERVEV